MNARKIWIKAVFGTALVGINVAVFLFPVGKRDRLPLAHGPTFIAPTTPIPLAPPTPEATKTPSKAPLRPATLESDPWLGVANPPLDCALWSLDLMDHDARPWWIWRVGSKGLERFTPVLLHMSLWAPTPDGAIAVFSVRGPWLLTLSQETQWVWVYVPELDGEDPPPEPGGGVVYRRWEFPLDSMVPQHPKPDSQGWTTYHELDTICPVLGEELRVGPSLESASLGPLRLLPSPTLINWPPLKLIQFQGDWVRVEEPLEVGQDRAGLDEEHLPLLKVRWNPKRQGWIRWRVPGPIPKSWSLRLRARAEFGIID